MLYTRCRAACSILGVGQHVLLGVGQDALY